MQTPLCAALTLGLALSLGVACPPPIPPNEPGTVTPDKLPGSVSKLLAFAEQRFKLACSRSFDRRYAADALVALRKAQGRRSARQAVLLLGARVARALGERARSPGEQLKYAELGLKFTRPGRKRFNRQVAFHYFHAAHLGLKVDAYRAAAMNLVPKLRAAAERAVALDKRYDNAGPLRILGSLLVKVPSTAPFNGDVERGTKLLEQAVALAPQFPLNHFFLAEAYAKDDEVDRAVRHFNRVLCSPIGPDWDAVLAAKYRQKAKQALRQLKRSDAPKCP